MTVTPENVCGLDEAGRGALAGPLVAAAVLLSESSLLSIRQSGLPLKDGKLLTPKARRMMAEYLIGNRIPFMTETISAIRISHHGIARANRDIFRMLIRKIDAPCYIVDGNIDIGRIRNRNGPIRSVPHADAVIPSVILAGIIAKVTRDGIMETLHRSYPAYGWIRNKGYGTREHVTAIMESGPCRFHRPVFVRTALDSFTRHSLLPDLRSY